MATGEAVRKVKTSQNGAIGFWTAVPNRTCVGSFNVLKNIVTGQEIEFHVAPSSTAVQQGIVFKELPAGNYALVEFTCTLPELTRSVKYSERAVVDRPEARLVLAVTAGEVTDYGIIRVRTENVVGNNANVSVRNSGTRAVSEPSSNARLKGISDALGTDADAVVRRLAIRGGS
jgi:hypothetical protein